MTYGDTAYFAFVESNEPTDGSNKSMKDQPQDDPFLEVLSRRLSDGMGLPTDILWLDCVRADYFLGLDWRDEHCDANNSIAENRRRRQLLYLDPNQFEVAWVPINQRNEVEREQLARISEMPWHLITLDSTGILPAMTAPDFDLEDEGRQLKYVTHQTQAQEQDRRSLVNAFSLDFLPEMTRGDDDPHDHEPPTGGSPKKGKKSKTKKRKRDRKDQGGSLRQK